MAERVEHRRHPPVGLVLGLALDHRAPLGGAPHGAVDVVDLQVQRVAVRPAWLGSIDAAFEPRIRQHQHGVAERQLGVADRAVGTLVEPAADARGEHVGVPGDRLAGAAHGDVGRQRRRPGDVVAGRRDGEVVRRVDLDVGHVGSSSGDGGGEQ
jgi:hypothetical protein